MKEPAKTARNEGLVGPVPPDNYHLYDDYGCGPVTPDDKIDPALAAQIAEDLRLLGQAEGQKRSTRA